LLADSGTGTQPRPQASPDRDAGCGQASEGRASAKLVPHASLGLRFRGARDQARRRKRNYRPRRITGQQPEGSRRLASRPVSPGGCVAFSWCVPGGLRPGEQKGALPEPYGRQIRGLALFAPVAGERQLRPRSHGHGHAVHPFITLPAPYARARAAHESPGHMVVQLNVTVCDMLCSWLTREYPPFCTGTVPSVRPAGGEQIGVFCRVA